jgi:hypothetical protein
VLENSIDKGRSHAAYATLLKRFDVLMWIRQLGLAGDALTSVTNRLIARVLKRLTVAHAAQTQKVMTAKEMCCCCLHYVICRFVFLSLLCFFVCLDHC